MSELRNTWVNSLPEQVLENTQDIQELQQDATDEAINRENADNALQSQITEEVSAREAADQNLQQQINDNTLPATISGIADKIQTNQNHTYIFSKDNAEPGSPMNASAVLLSNDSADTDSNYAGLQAVKPQTSGGANYTQLLLQYDSDGTAHANINVFENGSQSKTVDLLASGGGIQSKTTTFGNLYTELNNLNETHQVLYVKYDPTVFVNASGSVRALIDASGNQILTNFASIFTVGTPVTMHIECISESQLTLLSFKVRVNNFDCNLQLNGSTIVITGKGMDGTSTEFQLYYIPNFDVTTQVENENVTIYYI